MADDILSVGLDTSGFSPEKKKNLQDFILLFETLEKYDGRKFSPLQGSGLGEFNASAQETNALLTQINFKLATLNSNVDGFTTKAAAGIKKVKIETVDTNNQVNNLGRTLTRMLGYLRTAAYVLPGIGLAGIFNLGFQAIVPLLDKMGIMSTEEEKQIKLVKEWTVAMEQLEEQFYKIYEANKKMFDSIGKGSIGDLLEQIDEGKLAGVSKYATLLKEIAELKQRSADADKPINANNGSGGIQYFINEGISLNEQIKAKALELDLLQTGNLQHTDENGKSKKYSKDESKEQIDLLNAEIKSIEFKYKEVEKIVHEYYDSHDLLSKKQKETEKYILDENRKEYVKNETEKLNLTIENNKNIVKNKLSSDSEILNAEKDILKAKQGIIGLNLFNVTEDKDIYGNASKSTQELSIAKNKAETENLIAIEETKEKLFELTEGFYQRDLKANTETEKNKLDSIALANERIFQNDKKSLQERLDAYKAYIKAKNDIAYLEEKKDLDVLGLSPAQKGEISSNREKNVANNSANAEKVLYDIVYSSEQAKLKAIIDGNILQDQEMKAQHAKELEDLNTSFANKTISYRAFIGKKKEIDQRYKISEEEQNITNDIQELKRLDDLLKEQEARRDSFAQQANSTTNAKQKEQFSAEFDAETLAINDTNKEKLTAQQKLDKDLLDQEKATAEKLLTGQKQLESNKKAIQQAAFNLAKQLVDQDYQNRIEKIGLEKEAQDEQFASRETALEKSSLNEKNKTAYEIQLSEQKREYNISALKEEKKLKHDQALEDKELALSESAINGFQAVTKTLAEYGGTPLGFALALSVGTLAALQTASIALTDIPGYEFGTQGTPHGGGLARIGEGGKLEKVKEPGRAAYFVNEDQIVNLPKGTEVFPMNDTPVFGSSVDNSGWEQTMMIVGAIKKQKKEIKNIIKPVLTVNMGWEAYKNRIFNG